MFIFLAVGTVTFLVFIIVIVATEQISKRGRIHYVEVALKDFVRLVVRQNVLIGFIVAMAILLMAFVIFAAFSWALEIDHRLYPVSEILGSDNVTKGLLGMIFGALLASWIARIYNMPPDAKLPLVQKLEGFSILLLFVLGTTGLTVEEMIRSVAYDGGLKFQLAGRIPNNIGSSRETTAKQVENVKKSTTPSSSGFLDGFQLIKGLPYAIRADENYIGKFAKTNSQAEETGGQSGIATKFENNFGPTITCISDIIEKTEDRRYIFSRMAPLRGPLGAIYLHSTDESSRKEEYKAAVDELNWELYLLAFRLRRYASMLPGLDSCKQLTAGQIDPSELEIDSIQFRPYMATIYASLLFMDGQQRQALDFFDKAIDKITTYPATENAPAVNVRTLTRDDERFWYSFRALANFQRMGEDYIEREGSKTPDYIRDAYLRRAEQYHDLLKRIDERIPFQSLFGMYRIDDVSGRTLSSLGFERDPRFRQRCSDASEFTGSDDPMDTKLAALLSYVYLSSRSLYLYRALEHPEFEKRYLTSASEIAERIANVDLNCAGKVLGFPKYSLKLQRAEFLHVYVAFQLKIVTIKRRIGGDYNAWISKRLRLANNAAELALEVLESIDYEDVPTDRKDNLNEDVLELRGKLTTKHQFTRDWLDELT